jgi:hypothetical protein
VPSELNKYGTDKELQRSDNSIFCVAHLGFFRTWQKGYTFVQIILNDTHSFCKFGRL